VSTRRRHRGPSTLTVAKDIISYLLGWGLILQQALIVPPKDFNLTLVLMGGALVGIPGVGQLLAIRTGGSPSPDRQEGSPRPSPSSPSESAADR
jgi:hypothetical protein